MKGMKKIEGQREKGRERERLRKRKNKRRRKEDKGRGDLSGVLPEEREVEGGS